MQNKYSQTQYIVEFTGIVLTECSHKTIMELWLQCKGVDDMNKSHPKGKETKDDLIRCRVSKDLKDKLETYCRENGRTISDVIIEGINKVIKKK